MTDRSGSKQTILVAFQKRSDIDYLADILSGEDYRIIGADSFLSLIDSLERYCIHLVIAEVELSGISMVTCLPFLHRRYADVKVIVAMKEYSPRMELDLRSHNILYVMPWPVSRKLLTSVVAKGLERKTRGKISA